ncbi:MAG: Ig-like domain-containing protein, partial [Desulfobacterales bacterium]
MKAQYAKITVQVLLVSLLAFLLVGCGESGNPGGDTGPGQTASISISSDAESLPANGEGSANLRLELSDAAGEPVDVRTSVSLHTNLGNFRGGGKESRAKTVDESGEVMVSFNAGTTPGKAEIWAESNGVKQKIEIMLIDPDKAGALTLDAGNEAIVADGSSQVGVFATVTNKDEPLEGVRVEFETTLGKFVSDNEAASQEGSLPGLDEIGESGKRVKAVTDGDGEARVMLESGTDRGVAMVTARIGGYLETTTIQFISGPPVSISLRAAPSTIKPYGTTDLIATLLDAHDNPVEEETINFYEVLNESGGSLEELTATTNVNGEAKVPYSAGTITGKDIIQAAAESTAVLTTTEITVDPEAIVVDSIEVTSGSSDLVADGSDETTILATVTDIDEEPAVGKTVEFTTTAGTLVSQSAETDENGIARVRLRSSTNTGPAKVRAKCDGFIGEREVEFIAGPADHILLYALPDVVPPNGAFEVVAGVMDQYDNRLMETERVTFKIRKAGESNVLDSAELTPDEAEDGVYRYDWTASYEADELEIMAETARGISETKTVRVEEGALIVGDINISSGTDRLDPDGVSSTAIRATVTDNNGDPASGITVDFSTTLGSLSETSAVTDANGIAEVSLIAGNSGGVATVTADANGFKARTEVEFLSSAAGRIIVNAVPGTIKPEGTTTIEAKVIDSKGNPIEGAPLNFDVYQN